MSPQSNVSGGDGVQQRGVEQRERDVHRSNQEVDLGAAKDNALRTCDGE
jgi:hypothetical protein